MSQILGWQGYAAFVAGDPIAARSAGEEGRDLADAIGDTFTSRFCRAWSISFAQTVEGDLVGAAAESRRLVAEADAAVDVLHGMIGRLTLGQLLAWQGLTVAAHTEANAVIQAGAELGGFLAGLGYLIRGVAAIASGDAPAAVDALEVSWRLTGSQHEAHAFQKWRRAEAALGAGDLTAAQRWADEAASTTTGHHLMLALTIRARISIARDQLAEAERDAHDALAIGADIGAQLGLPGILECLARMAGEAGSHREASRLFGAAMALQERTGEVRFQIYQTGYESAVEDLQDAMSEADFDAAWAEGAALSTDEAIAYARRGRGERKRPANGWASLTPTELDVVRLLSEGLANKDIAARLFVSPRTVQTHLTHVYTKLGLTSRVQLAQAAARHT